MKIRNGFVSNSSSSSFVVAFPKKPKTADEVGDMLFGSNKYGTVQPYDFCEPTPNQAIAERVFRDIKDKKPKKSEVVEEFSGRYFGWNGKPYYRADKYCSTDNMLMLRLMRLESQDEELDKAERKELDAVIEKVIPKVPYAFKGYKKAWNKEDTYTDEEVAAYEKFCKAQEKFMQTDKTYLSLRNKHWAASAKRNKEMKKIREQLANMDADKFYADHKGHFIVVLTYGDENGDGNIEHGDVFRNLPHIQVSHH